MSQYANMGIVEFDAEIKAGRMTADQVLAVLDARIAKRARDGKKPIAKVIEYRNSLAGGTPALPVPTYAKPVASATGLPTDIADLIRHVKATVPQSEMAGFVVAIVN